ncbi:MAG: FHA domain-containing protein [Treponema sp.]|nr:FHA domain-containing protein [Treponema sp.]MBR6154587.1 FHA domain-containing protein [Treponema sp.]
MEEQTIINESPIGKHLDRLADTKQVSYLVFNNKKIQLVKKITIGRDYDNEVVIDNKLASRHHCSIQKIRDEYFLKDENSTNGTFLNDHRIPSDKYVKLATGDKITVGSASLVMG